MVSTLAAAVTDAINVNNNGGDTLTTQENFDNSDKLLSENSEKNDLVVSGDGDDVDVNEITTSAVCKNDGEWSENSGPPSLSVSFDLHNHLLDAAATKLKEQQEQENNRYSPIPSPEECQREIDIPSDTSCAIKVIGNQAEEESYEGFGSVKGDIESPTGSSSAPSPTADDTDSVCLRNLRSPNSTIGRHSWLRTSLRRTPPSLSKKRLSSNALASQLYRSGSFNSSGRGSICDTTDDMYSDVSLEDDAVLELNHKIQMIQDQMHAFADTQSVGEERYARSKQENATLQARVLMLEEAAKDAECRAEERLQAEQRRHRELASRSEREKQLQLENYAIKLQSVEQENSNLKNEIGKLREQLEKIKIEKERYENDLDELRRETVTIRENEKQAIVRANEAHRSLSVAQEEFSMREEADQQKFEELSEELERVRSQNKSLEESRDEWQAAAALQAGRELLMMNPYNNNVEKGPSLAAELLAGMKDQTDGGIIGNLAAESCNLAEMRQALKEQQEVNSQLRSYIDGILLNIVENYPQLLEVKQPH